MARATLTVHISEDQRQLARNFVDSARDLIARWAEFRGTKSGFSVQVHGDKVLLHMGRKAGQ